MNFEYARFKQLMDERHGISVKIDKNVKNHSLNRFERYFMKPDIELVTIEYQISK